MKPTFGTRQKIFSAVLLLLLVWGGYRHWDALKLLCASAQRRGWASVGGGGCGAAGDGVYGGGSS